MTSFVFWGNHQNQSRSAWKKTTVEKHVVVTPPEEIESPEDRWSMSSSIGSSTWPKKTPPGEKKSKLRSAAKTAVAAARLKKGGDGEDDESMHGAVGNDFESREAEEGFKRSVFLMSAEEQRRLSIGRLDVRVIEAMHLPAADFGGFSDPYVVVRLTGRNSWGQLWSAQREQRWRTRTVKRNLNPHFHEGTSFNVPRVDALLRIEVYDADDRSSDDFLGWLEIHVADLRALGTVKRWWPLHIDSKYAAPSAAVHLSLKYECSKLGEAVSFLWEPEPRDKPPAKFDINQLLTNASVLKKESQPYFLVYRYVDDVLAWKEPVVTVFWMVVVVGVIASEVAEFWVVFHVVFALGLVINGLRLAQLAHVKDQAERIFRIVDADGSGTLDRQEIGHALARVADVTPGASAPSKSQVDELFERHDLDKSGHLSLDEFSLLLSECPAIVGTWSAVEMGDDDDDDTDVFVGDDLNEDGLPVVQVSLQRKNGSSDTLPPTPAKVRRGVATTTRSFGSSARHTSLGEDAPPPPTQQPITRISSMSGDSATATPRKGDAKEIRGAGKVVANLVGRRLGHTATLTVRQLGDRGNDLIKIRSLFEWRDPKTSAAAVLGNLALAWVHAEVDPRFAWSVFAILIFIHRTRVMRVLERCAAKGPTALARYAMHEDLLKLKNKAKLYDGDRRAGSVHAVKRHHTQQRLFQKMNYKGVQLRALKSVLRNIFSRLDADGSGSVDRDELCVFVLRALPNATRGARNRAGLPSTDQEEAIVRDKGLDGLKDMVHQILSFDELDANGDGGIDYSEFNEIVVKSGCAEVLIQDELHRQLLSPSGHKCVKWPNSRSLGQVLGTHSTSLRLHPHGGTFDDLLASSPRDRRPSETFASGYDLSYTNRHGHRHHIPSSAFHSVGISTSKKTADVRHVDLEYLDSVGPSAVAKSWQFGRPQTKILRLSVAPILREPLLDLLKTRLMDGELPPSRSFNLPGNQDRGPPHHPYLHALETSDDSLLDDGGRSTEVTVASR